MMIAEKKLNYRCASQLRNQLMMNLLMNLRVYKDIHFDIFEPWSLFIERLYKLGLLIQLFELYIRTLFDLHLFSSKRLV